VSDGGGTICHYDTLKGTGRSETISLSALRNRPSRFSFLRILKTDCHDPLQIIGMLNHSALAAKGLAADQKERYTV